MTMTASTLSFLAYRDAAHITAKGHASTHHTHRVQGSAVGQGSLCAGEEELWRLCSISSARLSTHTASFICESLAVEYTTAWVGKSPQRLRYFTTPASKKRP